MDKITKFAVGVGIAGGLALSMACGGFGHLTTITPTQTPVGYVRPTATPIIVPTVPKLDGTPTPTPVFDVVPYQVCQELRRVGYGKTAREMWKRSGHSWVNRPDGFPKALTACGVRFQINLGSGLN